jgi:hypothetical protein
MNTRRLSRRSLIVAARAAAQAGDVETARATFALVGISYAPSDTIVEHTTPTRQILESDPLCQYARANVARFTTN